MKRLFKWLAYLVGLTILLVVAVLATAYWNRDKLLARVTAELNKDINGTAHIEKIDFTVLHHFPNFSITLHNLSLRDNQYERYRQDIVHAKKVVLDLELLPLLEKEIIIHSMSVDEGKIFIFKARNGDTNVDVFKKKASESNQAGNVQMKEPVFLSLKEIMFRRVSFVYADTARLKFITFQFLHTQQNVSRTDSGYTAHVSGKMHFDSLHFNDRSRSFLTDKDLTVDLSFHASKENLLTIQSSKLVYKQNAIHLVGSFKLQKEGKYNLLFTSDKIKPAEATELLNPKLQLTLNKFKIEDPIRVKVNLQGKSMPGYIPYVDVNFETAKATVHYGTLDFTSLSAKGWFTNHVDTLKPRDNDNSKLTISSFEGAMEKLPVKGTAIFTSLQDPLINLSFKTKLSFNDINKHLDNNRFVLTRGTFATEVFYNGKLSEYLDHTRTHYTGKLAGTAQATNVYLQYKPKKINLNNVFLKCSFNENVFTIHDLNLHANGSKVSMQGTIKNFIPFFIQPKNKGTVNLHVHSSDFDLTTFTTRRDVSKNKSSQKSKQDRKKVTDLIDRVYEKLEFDVMVNVDRLRFRKFVTTNLKGRVKLENSLLQANPISMRLAEGSMALNLSLSQIFDPTSPMKIEANLVNADIKKLFEHFNNFNQRTIGAENLEGKISAKVKFSATLDENYTLLPSTMRGTLDCKIVDGGLKNFEPIENMSNFLLKKRDFSDVQFAELNSAFSIEGTNMDISRMEIQSTVLSLFLEGRYSFTDSTSLSVQIPLSNLKKRHKDFKPKNIGIHAKAGPSVFLHVYRDRDMNSKIKIDYDPFKKWASN
jgi:uncharacterized protein involved in outer membrane biogenesis